MSGKYDSLLRRGRHFSEKHPPMPNCERAAQFAPFAALQTASMVVVAMRRNDARRHRTPLSISVSIDTTPPDTPTPPTEKRICRSKTGLRSPTAHTSGRTMRSL